ncbi:hypothetical protein D3OALGA1CA_113 [Olavius algarvensis associated proteobacterium Delta 3]|nr:hypothetical protein D3OALGA1CA_113 [Olavius algarvensis associated proteobacterium Delta 3]
MPQLNTRLPLFGMLRILIAAWMVVVASPPDGRAQQPAFDGRRFFHSGDGRIRLANDENGMMFSGIYRRGGGNYDRTALEAICGVFNAPYDPEFQNVSLRLVEYLDFLEDRLSTGATITIVSGYRSPHAITPGCASKGGLLQRPVYTSMEWRPISRWKGYPRVGCGIL